VLTLRDGWVRVAEVNPPELPGMGHLALAGRWQHVLVTDNVFGRIRVSPYAFAARLTHDVPDVQPTVVVSTRDRNILAIESEVRGALGNGVASFLVVVGDTMPHVDHLAHHHEIVRHLRELQLRDMPSFEVGMPTRFQRWQFRQRVDLGAEFVVVGPVIDPATVAPQLDRLGLGPGDPPVFAMVVPPFGLPHVERLEEMGAVAVTDPFRKELTDVASEDLRAFGWHQARSAEAEAEAAGCDGVILVGLSFPTITDEAPAVFLSAERREKRTVS
jgi:5,10-methylenetetrahydrofolate reductase